MFRAWQSWANRGQLPGLKYPGVYLIALSSRRLTDVPFRWDRHIVYVGMTVSLGGLASRLRQFDDTIAHRRTSHGGADRVRYRHPNYARLVRRLYVTIQPVRCDTSDLSARTLRAQGRVARLEYECLAKYVEHFGRLPRFNDKPNSPKLSLAEHRVSPTRPRKRPSSRT